MGGDWPDVSIESIAANHKGAIAIGPFGSRMKADTYEEKGIPVVRGTNLSSGRKFTGNFVYINELLADSLGSCNVYKDDLIFPHRGAIGEVGIVSDESRFVLSSSMMKLTCDKEKVDAKFLFYYFKSHVGRHQLLQNASQVGTPGIGQPLSSLRSIRFRMPPLGTQIETARILGTLDDKIELNRQTNKTLEAMAQAMFKSWFVDFDLVIDNALAAGNDIPESFQARAAARQALGDARKPLPEEIRCEFPDEFVFSDEMGWVPCGWGSKKIKDFGSVVTGRTPSKNLHDAYSDDGYNFVTPTDVDSSLVILRTKRHLSSESFESLKRICIPSGSISVTCIGSQMGKTFICGADSVTNQQINSIVLYESADRFYLTLNLRGKREKILQLGSSGSTMPILNKSAFESLPVLFPEFSIRQSFSEVIRPLFASIVEADRMNYVLTDIRDTLLPNLLSGQLTITKAEKLVAEVL